MLRPPSAAVKRRPATANPAGGAPPRAAAVIRRPAAAKAARGAPPPSVALVKRRLSSNAYKTRVAVKRGAKAKTAGGLRSIDLWYPHSTGKVVSIVKQQQAKKQYVGSKVQVWSQCVAEARVACGFHRRFVPVGGRTEEGQRLLETTRAIKRLRGPP